MDIHSLGIPNIAVTYIGSKRDPIEIVEATLRLEAWDGYLTKRWENAKEIADGTVKVYFACNTRSLPEDWETQVAAYNHLIEHQAEIRDIIVAEVIANIDHLKGYLDANDPGVPQIPGRNPTGSEGAPENKTAFDLRPYIGPQSVSILDEIKEGLAYVEWALNCTWDTEHGLAAVTHRNRLIDLDRGETDIYKIFADNGTLEEELEHAKRFSNQPNPQPPKPWWKFW